MKTALILAAALATACSAAASRPRTGPAAQERTTQVLTEEDLRRQWEPGEEEKVMARAAAPEDECAEATSLVRGSFTRPGARQAILSVRAGPCDGPGSRNVLVVYEGGREVWRADGAPAVRAMDVDGDGQDEWLKLWRDCRAQECRAEAWLSGADGDILHVEDAEERHCGESGMVRWTSVSVRATGADIREARTEHWRECP